MDLKNGGHLEEKNKKLKKEGKSVFWTYVLWMFGGLVGAHHIYLERDAQAFVYFSTLGGYVGLGWLRDIYKIPSYVQDANDHPNFLNDFKQKVRNNRKVGRLKTIDFKDSSNKHSEVRLIVGTEKDAYFC